MMFEASDWLNNLNKAVERKPFSFCDEMLARNYRRAAVLVLFWDEQGQPATVVTVRSNSMPTHAGEVSFPGGRLHEGETFAQAALREAQEEVGLDPGNVKVLGRLDDAWSGAGFALVPIVAISDSKPEFGISDEVQRVVTMNLSTEAEIIERKVNKFGYEFTEPVIRTEGADVVGLSADILSEAMEALKGEYTERGKRRYEHFQRYAKELAAT